MALWNLLTVVCCWDSGEGARGPASGLSELFLSAMALVSARAVRGCYESCVFGIHLDGGRCKRQVLRGGCWELETDACRPAADLRTGWMSPAKWWPQEQRCAKTARELPSPTSAWPGAGFWLPPGAACHCPHVLEAAVNLRQPAALTSNHPPTDDHHHVAKHPRLDIGPASNTRSPFASSRATMVRDAPWHPTLRGSRAGRRQKHQQ